MFPTFTQDPPASALVDRYAEGIMNSVKAPEHGFTTLWRLEDRNGDGVYKIRHPEWLEDLLDASSFCSAFPGWDEDSWYDHTLGFLGIGGFGLVNGLSRITNIPNPSRGSAYPLHTPSVAAMVTDLRAGTARPHALLAMLDNLPSRVRTGWYESGIKLMAYSVISEAVFFGSGYVESAQVAFYEPASERVQAFSLADFNPL